MACVHGFTADGHTLEDAVCVTKPDVHYRRGGVCSPRRHARFLERKERVHVSLATHRLGDGIDRAKSEDSAHTAHTRCSVRVCVPVCTICVRECVCSRRPVRGCGAVSLQCLWRCHTTPAHPRGARWCIVIDEYTIRAVGFAVEVPMPCPWRYNLQYSCTRARSLFAPVAPIRHAIRSLTHDWPRGEDDDRRRALNRAGTHSLQKAICTFGAQSAVRTPMAWTTFPRLTRAHALHAAKSHLSSASASCRRGTPYDADLHISALPPLKLLAIASSSTCTWATSTTICCHTTLCRMSVRTTLSTRSVSIGATAKAQHLSCERKRCYP